MKKIQKTTIYFFTLTVISLSFACRDTYIVNQYDKIQQKFTDKISTKDHASCLKKCESSGMILVDFDRDKTCSCSY
ncbi:MAG: hypothetical protein U0457_08080 [Candidatus Sericytochromatia bacterium]